MSRRKALDGLDAGRGIDDYLGTAHFATKYLVSAIQYFQPNAAAAASVHAK
jgi:hypothetical protein